MKNFSRRALALHKKDKGKIGLRSLFSVKTKDDLSLAYTPGVAAISRAVAQDKNLSFDLTLRGRSIAVVSDGSAVLGLGNIGPEAALPVMEGKALLFKVFANIDAFPLVIGTQTASEIIKFVKNIAPSFAGINLEDISSPQCFEIEEALSDIGIPVFHDDQHGAAIAVRAALINAAKVVGKDYASLRVVLIGAGAAGTAVAKLLLGFDCRADTCTRLPTKGVKDLIAVDSKGPLWRGREMSNVYKQALVSISNKENRKGSVDKIIEGFDVVIGLSKPGLITGRMIKKMAKKPIVFALANPTPEIMPEEAVKAGAYIIATGRSDAPNQINNVLVFPGIFRAALDLRLKKISPKMHIWASDILAGFVKNPRRDKIIPSPFYPHISYKLAEELKKRLINKKP